MSFAKVLSAGRCGGAVAVRSTRSPWLRAPVHWLRSALMTETAAVAALDQLDGLDMLLDRRRAVAAVYGELAATGRGCGPAGARRRPRTPWSTGWPGRRGDGHRRAAELDRRGVHTKPYYAPALHWHARGPARSAAEALPVSDALVDTRWPCPCPRKCHLCRPKAGGVAQPWTAARR